MVRRPLLFVAEEERGRCVVAEHVLAVERSCRTGRTSRTKQERQRRVEWLVGQLRRRLERSKLGWLFFGWLRWVGLGELRLRLVDPEVRHAAAAPPLSPT